MDIRRFDLNLLLLIDRIHATGSVSAAARSLGLSQPVASAKLGEARTLLGDRLFVRTGRGMRPTPFADQIVPAIRQALISIERGVLARPAFDPALAQRTFTVTTSDIGVLVFLPTLLQAVARQAPNVSLNCESLPHHELIGAMERGAVDLAIGYFPDVVGPNVAREELFEHPFACLARSGHPHIDGHLSLDGFLAAEHLVVYQQGRSQEIVERRIRELGLKRHVRLHLPNFLSVPQMIARTDMISVVPISLGIAYAPLFALQILPVPFDVPPIDLAFFWHRRSDGDPEMVWFRELVRSELVAVDPARELVGRSGIQSAGRNADQKGESELLVGSLPT